MNDPSTRQRLNKPEMATTPPVQSDTASDRARSFERALQEFGTALRELAPTQRFMSYGDFADELIAERDLRARHLDIEFAEAGWDMMIDLLRAEERRENISVSSLALASRVPATTALRHIAQLKLKNMIEDHPDPFDKRRIFLRLNAESRRSLLDYLKALADRRQITLTDSSFIS